jgi:hypothetical protein
VGQIITLAFLNELAEAAARLAFTFTDPDANDSFLRRAESAWPRSCEPTDRSVPITRLTVSYSETR